MSHQSLFCKAGACATKALNRTVCAAVSVAALEQYAKIAEMIKSCLCIDINKLFTFIACLAVLCWIGQWVAEIINFVTKTIPRFVSNLCQGKFSLCLLDCKRPPHSHSHSHSNDEDSTEY